MPSTITKGIFITTAPVAGGCLTFHLESAASTNQNVIKNSPGQVYGWYVYNSNSAARKLCFHNSAATPTAGAGIYYTLVLPGLSAADVFFPIGIAHTTGIAITTVVGLPDNSSAPVAADDLNINIYYQ